MIDYFYFGKLPSFGDFIFEGLDANERLRLDDWLAREIVAGVAGFGKVAFDVAYRAAPPWRFCWNDGRLWSAGAIACSTDASGRLFPFLFGVRGLSVTQIATAAEVCEQMAINAIVDTIDGDKIDDALADIVSLDDDRSPEQDMWWTQSDDGAILDRRTGRWPDGLIRQILAMQVSGELP